MDIGFRNLISVCLSQTVPFILPNDTFLLAGLTALRETMENQEKFCKILKIRENLENSKKFLGKS